MAINGEEVQGVIYDEVSRHDATGEIIDGKATIDGMNIFHEISTLSNLVPTLAGASTMCWETPAGAGELQTEELNAICNAFAERATDIIWTRIYQHLNRQFKELDPMLSEEKIEAKIRFLCAGMDLWN